MTETPDHILRNRVAWDRMAADYAAAGLRSWQAAQPSWGVWGVAEEQLGVLPPDLAGLDSIELGCGTGYVSAWLARRGARPVGLDNSAAQLVTARTLQDRSGCGSLCSMPAQSERRARTRASTWLSRSTAQVSGAIPMHGFRKPPECYARAAS